MNLQKKEKYTNNKHRLQIKYDPILIIIMNIKNITMKKNNIINEIGLILVAFTIAIPIIYNIIIN